MLYARIDGGQVVELFTPPTGVAITNCFHAGMTWVDVTAVSPAPQPGWTYIGTTFAAPVAPAVDTRPVAQDALDKSDMTALRCFKAGMAFPANWQTYVVALRAIVAGGPTSAALPVQPAYPVGT